MTGVARGFHLLKSIDYILERKIPGAVVECGVWKGGSMVLAAKRLIAAGACDRELFLYDTFSGMTSPTDIDRDLNGDSAAELLRRDRSNPESHVVANAPLALVQDNLRATRYPGDRIHFVQGPVETTLPVVVPQQIALLRLDTDWYESTKHELIHLYPKLARGGVLIIDDYGHWQGARRATDEYMSSLTFPLLLHRIDATCRAGVKPD